MVDHVSALGRSGRQIGEFLALSLQPLWKAPQHGDGCLWSTVQQEKNLHQPKEETLCTNNQSNQLERAYDI